jgi:hypothetical protein
MLFLRHPAWLWLKKHDKSKLPPIDENTQAIFDAGFVFESYAEQLFPDAVKIESNCNDYQAYRELTPKTLEAINSGAKTIIQGRFEAGDITCICDVIVKVDDKTFDLYEIKSSTQAKPEHEYDLAFQVEVIERNNYKVRNIFVIHVNNEFIKNGEVEAGKLTKITEVTESVKKLKDFTKENIAKALEVINQKERPDISPAHAKLGAFSDWLSIYKTMADIDEYSIYHLCSPGASKIGELEALGIKKIADIPDNFVLNEKQLRQVQSTKHNKVLINHDQIKQFLAQLKFPLYFLDYETLSSVVPYFDGLGPYKQLPFQYSLHVLDKPNGELKHYEYLHNNNSNPIKPLTETLKSQIGDDGTVLVWFEGFEKSCNELMGTIMPTYYEFYKSINNRIIDLMTPFSTGAYVHKDFFGSASIKKVLPVLIPELSYKDLDINEGGSAQRLWMDAVLYGKRETEKDKILADLLKYCGLDTLAMVKIYEFLVKSVLDNGKKYILIVDRKNI